MTVPTGKIWRFEYGHAAGLEQPMSGLQCRQRSPLMFDVTELGDHVEAFRGERFVGDFGERTLQDLGWIDSLARALRQTRTQLDARNVKLPCGAREKATVTATEVDETSRIAPANGLSEKTAVGLRAKTFDDVGG